MWLRSRKALSEDIHKFKLCGDMRKIDNFAIIFISIKMTIDLNMPRSFMKHRIFGYSNGICIISKKWCRLSLREAKV